jgi:sulfoxide reductase heme-binding subunit YedZ
MTAASETAAQQVSFGTHAFWLASRATGITAMALLTFTVIVGLLQGGNLLSGFSPRFRQRHGIKARDLTRVHEFCSLGAIVLIAGHGLLLLGDPWLSPTLTQIAVPFKLGYRSFYTGMGITAGWIVGLLGLSYYLRDQIGPKRWRSIHRFTIVGYALSVVHVLGAGTDASQSWLLYPMLGSTVVVALLFALRVSSAREPVAAAPQPRRQSAQAQYGAQQRAA